MLNSNAEVTIKNFNLSLFKQLINESLSTHNHIMLEVDSNFIKSLSLTASNTLMKICYTKTNSLVKGIESVEGFDMFNLFVMEGNNFEKYLKLYSELEQVNVTFTLIDDVENVGKKIASKMKIDGYTNVNKSKLITSFTMSSNELMFSSVSDYQTIIDKLKVDSEISGEFLIKRTQYKEVVDLINNLHKTISNNHSFVDVNISESGMKISDKVFDVTYSDEENIFRKYEDFTFKILKSDIKLLGLHNWKLMTHDSSDKVIMMSKTKPIEGDAEIIIGCILTKVNNATTVSNDANDYNEEDFELDLAEYQDI